MIAHRKLEDEYGMPLVNVKNVDKVSVPKISVADFESHNRECTLPEVDELLNSKKDP